MTKSKIEWTDATWNPWIGCTPASEGCDNCYAKREEDTRFRHLERCGPGLDIAKGEPYFNRGPVYQGDNVLHRPLHWKKPRRIFVCSRSDLFHESITFDLLRRPFAIMAMCPQHTFMVLTKRAVRMYDYFQTIQEDAPANVGLGVTVENQARANERIPYLLESPAAVRFVSHEPAIATVNYRRIIDVPGGRCIDALGGVFRTCIGADGNGQAMFADDADGRTGRISQVIMGGESGKNARPANPQWFRDVRDQCQAAGASFFFKQWGEYVPGDMLDETVIHRYHDQYSMGRCSTELIRYCDPEKGEFVRAGDGCTARGYGTMYRVGKKAAGRELDGRTWDEFPTLELITPATKGKT